MSGMSGRKVPEHQKDRIAKLLAETKLSMNDIARRMGLSSGLVSEVNRQRQIRGYIDGKRTGWRVSR